MRTAAGMTIPFGTYTIAISHGSGNTVNKKPSVSLKQLLLALGFLLAFSSMTILLFFWQRDEKRFTNITTQLFTEDMKSNTLNMHYTIAHPEDFGIYDYTPTLGIYDSEASLRSQTQTENTLAALHAIHREKLSDTDACLWQLLTRSLKNTLELNRFPYYSQPLSPSSGAQTQLPILLAEYAFRTRQDVEDYLALLDQTDAYFASLLTYEQEKAAAGLATPGSFLKEVRAQCDAILTESDLEAGTHFLQTTFRDRIDALCQSGEITEAEAQRYLATNDRLLQTVLLPAYTALGDGLLLLEDDSVLPAGLASYPEGKAYYEQLMISRTGSYRPINELQILLTEQFSKIYEEIRRLVSSRPDIASYLGQDASVDFPYQNASQMLLDLQQRMSGQFPAIPGGDAKAAVKAVSASLEPYCAPAFYLTVPLDDTDQNTIYINLSKTPAGLDLYTTLAHEGYPGHLYQTVYHNRQAALTEQRPVRELLWYGGYIEGWALYVEFLSFDYASDLLREDGKEIAALTAQLEKYNRSLQLCLYSLLDVLIHYEGASYSHVASLLEGFGITSSDSVKSLYNYIIQEPCNYLKYYVGYLEILKLQEQAKALWGDEYTDYRFHCFYLDCGPCDFLSLAERLETYGAAADGG